MKTNVTLDEALEKASPALRKKMLHSVELLRKAEKIALRYDQNDGFFLAFSGGKDSQALIHIAQLAGVRFKAHMNLTSVDPADVIRFVRHEYPEVELIKPKTSMYALAIKKNFLPTMRIRYCCAEFKEKAGAGRVVLIGIRHEEGTRRAKRNEVEMRSQKFSGNLEEFDEYRQQIIAKRLKRESRKKGVNITNADSEQTIGCISGKESLLVSPIIYWTEKDVWEFLNEIMGVPHCSLYDEGWYRIGCINCPMSPLRNKVRENQRFPHIKHKWIETIKKIRFFGGYHDLKTPDGKVSNRRWLSDEELQTAKSNEEIEQKTAEAIYEWWISQKSYDKWLEEKLQPKLKFNE